MLTLYVLAAMLVVALAAYAALGVEDDRFHSDYVPVRYDTTSPMTARWEDSLPGKPMLPWNQTTAEWAAAVEGE